MESLRALRRYLIPFLVTVSIYMSIYFIFFIEKSEPHDFLFNSFIYKLFFTKSISDKPLGVLLLIFKSIFLFIPISLIYKFGNKETDDSNNNEKNINYFLGSKIIVTCIILMFFMSVFVKINTVDLKPSEYSVSAGLEDMPKDVIFTGKYLKYYTIFGYEFGTEHLYEQKWLMEKEYLNEKVSLSENYLLVTFLFFLLKYKTKHLKESGLI